MTSSGTPPTAPARAPSSPPSIAPPAAPWKRWLALLSLSLSGLIWIGGLIDSLERPSVGNALTLRQLEIGVLASEALPPPLRSALIGDNPRATLRRELQDQMDRVPVPPPARQRLELALLENSGGDRSRARAQLRDLVPQVDEARRPLLEALIEERPVTPERQRLLLEPWNASILIRQLSCEQLGGPPDRCPARRGRNRLVAKVMAVTVAPVGLLLVGIGLLARELWCRWRGRKPTPPPLVGPPLSIIDTVLLIAGGFVLAGEIVAPLLLVPTLRTLQPILGWSDSTGQGVQVLLLYLGVMAVPLLILRLMLGKPEAAPPGGWLQWHWRPPGSALRLALGQLLMVLPLVAIGGWLVERIWSDPGGSNPLLELVLTSGNQLALVCFGLTAVVLAPLFEETLFRGVLLPVLGQRLGGPWAVLISAAVFALAHLSLGELVPLLILGTGLGWLRWRSGRLAASVIMHGLWNALTFANLVVLAG